MRKIQKWQKVAVGKERELYTEGALKFIFHMQQKWLLRDQKRYQTLRQQKGKLKHYPHSTYFDFVHLSAISSLRTKIDFEPPAIKFPPTGSAIMDFKALLCLRQRRQSCDLSPLLPCTEVWHILVTRIRACIFISKPPKVPHMRGYSAQILCQPTCKPLYLSASRHSITRYLITNYPHKHFECTLNYCYYCLFFLSRFFSL